MINEQNRPSGFYDEVNYQEGEQHLEEFRLGSTSTGLNRKLQELNYVPLNDGRYTKDGDKISSNNISRDDWINLNDENGQETLLEENDETIKDSVYRKDHTVKSHHVRTPLESLAKHYAHKYEKYGESGDAPIENFFINEFLEAVFPKLRNKLVGNTVDEEFYNYYMGDLAIFLIHLTHFGNGAQVVLQMGLSWDARRRRY